MRLKPDKVRKTLWIVLLCTAAFLAIGNIIRGFAKLDWWIVLGLLSAPVTIFCCVNMLLCKSVKKDNDTDKTEELPEKIIGIMVALDEKKCKILVRSGDGWHWLPVSAGYFKFFEKDAVTTFYKKKNGKYEEAAE